MKKAVTSSDVDDAVGGYTSPLMTRSNLEGEDGGERTSLAVSTTFAYEGREGQQMQKTIENSRERLKTEDGGDKIITTVEELLKATTAWRPYPLFIIISMSFLWSLCALSAISPAFTTPAADDCRENCSFYTIQHEFNLSSQFYFLDPAELTTSVYFLGNFLVGQFFAVLADKFGRRPIIIATLILTGVAGSLGAMAPNFPSLLVARLIQGSCFTPLTTVNYVLSGESIPRRSQSLTSIFFGVSWVCGYCFLAPLSVWFNTWRSLQLATSVPNFIVALFLVISLPESVSYSIENNDRKSVKKWIHKNETFSRRKLNYNLDLIMTNGKKPVSTDRPSISQMLSDFTCKNDITRPIIVETLLWIMTFMTYCALSLTSTSVGNSDPLASFLFSGVVELPAYLFIPICLTKTKRRPTRFLCHFAGSMALLTMYFLSYDTPVHLIIWLCAKFFASCCYIFCFIYAAELFPMYCRSCCIGVCSTCCNFGAIVAPHIFAIEHVAPGAPFLVLGAVGLVCSGLTWCHQGVRDKRKSENASIETSC